MIYITIVVNISLLYSQGHIIYLFLNDSLIILLLIFYTFDIIIFYACRIKDFGASNFGLSVLISLSVANI